MNQRSNGIMDRVSKIFVGCLDERWVPHLFVIFVDDGQGESNGDDSKNDCKPHVPTGGETDKQLFQWHFIVFILFTAGHDNSAKDRVIAALELKGHTEVGSNKIAVHKTVKLLKQF